MSIPESTLFTTSISIVSMLRVVSLILRDFHGQGIVVIEWAEKIAEFLPEDYILIQIELTGDNERLFHLRGACVRCAAVIMACGERLREQVSVTAAGADIKIADEK